MKRRFRPPPLGIRTQLTLWYTSISALLLLLFGFAFYSTLQMYLASSFDTTLQMRSQQVAETVSMSNGKLAVSNMVNELPELSSTAALIDSFDDTNQATQTADQSQGRDQVAQQLIVKHNVYVRVLDKNGQLVYSSLDFNAISIPPEALSLPLLKRTPWYGTITGKDDQEIRVYSTMLINKGQLLGVVQVGQSMDQLNGRLEHIAWALLLFTPLALLFSSLGCYWLAGRAFRPIHYLTATASEINEKELHQRVPVPSAQDEVRDLSLIFNQMIERLERSFGQQRRFVADASHELRTPVTVIRSMTEVALAQSASSDDYVAVLQGVNAESERLSKLINDLLALARADEGQVQFDHDEVRLDLLAMDAVASLEPLATERKMTIVAADLCPVTVLGDAARLIQVIISLLDNALTYTNPGGQVAVSVSSDGANAFLAVRDTGIGISLEDQKHIFGRFYRADPARSRVAGGGGLGLSIVDWIVRAHGGGVRVESTPGQGSTFIVSLPLPE